MLAVYGPDPTAPVTSSLAGLSQVNSWQLHGAYETVTEMFSYFAGLVE
jgi:hypothetical protein